MSATNGNNPQERPVIKRGDLTFIWERNASKVNITEYYNGDFKHSFD